MLMGLEDSLSLASFWILNLAFILCFHKDNIYASSNLRLSTSYESFLVFESSFLNRGTCLFEISMRIEFGGFASFFFLLVLDSFWNIILE